MVILGIVLHSPLVGLAAVLIACGSVICFARQQRCGDDLDEHLSGSDRERT
jgi:hypothetical protein